MSAISVNEEVVVHVCHNCLSAGRSLPRQWRQDGARVRTLQMPCSGKTEARYLFHVFESGMRGVCLVTCSQGECRLAQGNYRADVRVRTIQRLLEEIGVEPERIELLRFSPEGSAEELERAIREAVGRISGCKTGNSAEVARTMAKAEPRVKV